LTTATTTFGQTSSCLTVWET